MKKSILAFIAAMGIMGTLCANVQAEEVVVKKGDTLWGFSQAYQVSVGNIKEWNGLTSDLIHPNDKLEVSPTKKYIVVKDDNLWDISREYHVTVEELKDWNNLTSELIVPGQELTIELKANTNIDDAAKQAMDSQTSNTEKPTESIPAVTNLPEPASEPAPSEQPAETLNTEEGKELTMEATAYTANCEGCSGITATGINLIENPDQKVISVDPSVIPLGSRVYVEGYGEAIAGDTGGAIKGNKIDIFIPSKEEAIQWGRKSVKVQILN
jgi:3D (Asp-Asp-Asp) domain-containing protein/LysM repeat protein